MPECPDCEKMFRGKKCPSCGWRVAAAELPVSSGDAYCTWTTRGTRCGFMGVFQETYKHRLRCEWHSQPDSSGRAKDSYEEFERWVLIQRKHYCGQFSHDSILALWSVLDGAAPLPSAPTSCLQPDCRYRLKLAVDDGGNAAEYVRGLRRLVYDILAAHPAETDVATR